MFQYSIFDIILVILKYRNDAVHKVVLSPDHKDVVYHHPLLSIIVDLSIRNSLNSDGVLQDCVV